MDLDAINTDTDPDPAFPVNPDPVPDLGFWWLKIENNTAEKGYIFFYQKLLFIYPPDVQASGESFSISFFLFLWVIFAPPDPDLDCGSETRDPLNPDPIRLRIHKTGKYRYRIKERLLKLRAVCWQRDKLLECWAHGEIQARTESSIQRWVLLFLY